MKRQALLIGIFIVGALVLCAASVVWLSGAHLFSRQIQAVIYFEDGVSGLYVGAPVTFRGVPVGQVESIGLEFDAATFTERMPVNVFLSRDVVAYQDGSSAPPSLEALVQRGLRAKLILQSFVTGQRSIELNILPGAAPATLRHGARPEIPALPNQLDMLVNQLSELPIRDLVASLQATLKSTQATMDSVHLAMGSMRSTLDVTGKEVARLGTDARGTMGVAREAIVNLRAKSDATLTSVGRLADTANKAAGEIRPELISAIAKARDAAAGAEQAMRQVTAVASPDQPIRMDLQAAMADVAQAARALREWSELVEQQPNAIVFGRQRP